MEALDVTPPIEKPFSPRIFAGTQIQRLLTTPILHPEVNKYANMSRADIEKMFSEQGIGPEADPLTEAEQDKKPRRFSESNLDYFHDAIRLIQLDLLSNTAAIELAKIRKINNPANASDTGSRTELTHGEKQARIKRNQRLSQNHRMWVETTIEMFGLPKNLNSKEVTMYLQQLPSVCRRQQILIANKFVDPKEPADTDLRIKLTLTEVLNTLQNSSLMGYPFFEIQLPPDLSAVFTGHGPNTNINELVAKYQKSMQILQKNQEPEVRQVQYGSSKSKKPNQPTLAKTEVSVEEAGDSSPAATTYQTELESALMLDFRDRATLEEKGKKHTVQDGINLYYRGSKYGDPDKKDAGMKIWMDLGLTQAEIDRMVRLVDRAINPNHDPKPKKDRPDPDQVNAALQVYFFGLINQKPEQLREAVDQLKELGLSEEEIRKHVRDREKLSRTSAVPLPPNHGGK